MDLMKSGKFNLISNGKGLFQPIFIDDLVAGMILAIKNGKIGESYILCGHECITFKEYFSRLAKLQGIERLPSVPYWVAYTMVSILELGARIFKFEPAYNRTGVKGTGNRRDTYSIIKAQKELGFSIKEGLKKIKI